MSSLLLPKHEYASVPSENNTGDEPKSKYVRRHAGGYILLWLLSLVLVYILSIHYRPYTSYTYDDFDTRSRECGSSPSEARQRGCEWDPVSFAWLPERCLDRELAHEFLTQTNWTIHADPAGSIVKTDEAFSEDTSPTYLTNANHVLHCVYAWKRLHHLLLAGKPYHSGLSLDHTHHCGNVLLEALYRDPDEIRTRALVIYPSC